jgi:hypothetical protein
MATCIITGTIINNSGTPVEGVLVSVIPAEIPAIITGTTQAIVQSTTIAETTSTGDFSITLIQGVTYNVIIKAIGYEQRIKVPTATSAVLWTLAPITETGNDSGGGGVLE